MLNSKVEKNIVIITNNLNPGGAQSTAIKLSEYLSSDFEQVTILSLYSNKDQFFKYDSKIKFDSLNFDRINNNHSKVIAALKKLKLIRNFVIQNKINVIISLESIVTIIFVFSTLGLKTSIISSERNYPPKRKILRHWKILRKILYRYVDLHVAQTQKTANWLKNNTLAKSICVISNSIRWPLSHSSKADNIIENNQLSPYILSVGVGRAHIKGYDLLIEAFKQVSTNHPNFKLVIIGIDKEKNKKDYLFLSEIIEKHNLSDKVILKPVVTNIMDWYENAFMFVLSSRTEGFPNVLLESMASGCPSIAFNCDTGPSDIIEDKVNGLLVPAENVKLMATSILKLIDNKKLREKISKNGKRIVDRFSEEKIKQEWVEALLKIKNN